MILYKEDNKPKAYLYDVVIIRILLIVLLVVYHAFAPFSGAWDPINDHPNIPLYWWIDKFSYAFMLESFVFISGFVFGFQVRNIGERKLHNKSVFWGKFKRLMIPNILFSLIYILLLENHNDTILQLTMKCFNGVGHMWFLPMLYCCFICTWLIEKAKMPATIVFPILFVLSLLPLPSFPLHFDSTCYFLLFFYFGYYVQTQNIDLSIIKTKIKSIYLAFLFLILFIALTLLGQNLNSIIGGDDIFFKVLVYMIKRLFILLYSFTGIIMIFSFVGDLKFNTKDNKRQWILGISELCMGVYIFQQFVLKGLYYHTEITQHISPYVIPWLGLVLALFSSLFLSFLLRLTKLGRALI